ncbi:hypothetical protein P7K49_033089 [Saguinus oedipus]|uniref:Uncharacterized protein n=1 Tax=Saguinus oedipus TaxID=9490 RepID=A0ABQ9TQX8_SAGOE|nr:hypothetical protein P7K49_033089 [Saguinus oedipus]
MTGISRGRGGPTFLLDPRAKATLVLVIIQVGHWAFPVSSDFLAVTARLRAMTRRASTVGPKTSYPQHSSRPNPSLAVPRWEFASRSSVVREPHLPGGDAGLAGMPGWEVFGPTPASAVLFPPPVPCPIRFRPPISQLPRLDSLSFPGSPVNAPKS